MLRRHQTDIGHQLFGIFEARQIPDFGNERRSDDQPDAAQGLKVADQYAEMPGLHRFAQRGLETTDTCLRFQHRFCISSKASC